MSESTNELAQPAPFTDLKSVPLTAEAAEEQRRPSPRRHPNPLVGYVPAPNVVQFAPQPTKKIDTETLDGAALYKALDDGRDLKDEMVRNALLDKAGELWPDDKADEAHRKHFVNKLLAAIFGNKAQQQKAFGAAMKRIKAAAKAATDARKAREKTAAAADGLPDGYRIEKGKLEVFKEAKGKEPGGWQWISGAVRLATGVHDENEKNYGTLYRITDRKGREKEVALAAGSTHTDARKVIAYLTDEHGLLVRNARDAKEAFLAYLSILETKTWTVNYSRAQWHDAHYIAPTGAVLDRTTQASGCAKMHA